MAREAQESLFGSRARRHRPGLDLVAQSPAAMRAARLPTRWRSNLSPSGAARYFAAPPRYGQAAARRGGARAGGVLDLLNPHKLLSSTAFAAPALRMSTGTVGIRDPFSSRDNTSAARHSGDARPLERTGEQHTQAELMESRLAAMRERAMGEAWAWFEKGEYRRARASFENAEMLDRTHPEPRAGILFCCLAQRAYTQTIYSMGRILFWDGSRGNILGTDLNLLDRYAPPLKDRPDLREAEAVARLKRDVADFLAFAGHHRAKLSVQATVAYVLWHAGGRQEASRIARGMREYDPGGQFGQFADSILAAAGEEAEAGRGG